MPSQGSALRPCHSIGGLDNNRDSRMQSVDFRGQGHCGGPKESLYSI